VVDASARPNRESPTKVDDASTNARADQLLRQPRTGAPKAQVATEDNTPGGLGESLANGLNKFAGAPAVARKWVDENVTAATKKGLKADQGPTQETLDRANDALAPPNSSASIGHTLSREQLEQRSGDTLRSAKESLAEHTGHGGGLVAEKAAEYGQAKIVQVAATVAAAGVGVVVHAAGNARLTVQELSTAASQMHSGGHLTRAGHALQKHSSRAGSVFQATGKKAADYNRIGQDVVDDILTDPRSAFTVRKAVENKQVVEVIEVIAPDGRGLRFSGDGTKFIGLREP